jgi:hypothetical protein
MKSIKGGLILENKLDLLITNLELDNCNRIEKELSENNFYHTKEYQSLLEEELKLLEKKKRILNGEN